VELYPPGTSLIDILDRILDKGVVMDAWARIAYAGIVISPDVRIVVNDAASWSSDWWPPPDDPDEPPPAMSAVMPVP